LGTSGLFPGFEWDLKTFCLFPWVLPLFTKNAFPFKHLFPQKKGHPFTPLGCRGHVPQGAPHFAPFPPKPGPVLLAPTSPRHSPLGDDYCVLFPPQGPFSPLTFPLSGASLVRVFFFPAHGSFFFPFLLTYTTGPPLSFMDFFSFSVFLARLWEKIGSFLRTSLD